MATTWLPAARAPPLVVDRWCVTTSEKQFHWSLSCISLSLSLASFLRTTASCPMHVAVTRQLFSAAGITFSRLLFKILSQNLVAFCHGSAAAAVGVSLS